MDDPDGHFGERAAATYDDPADPANDPAAIAPMVDVLAELAGDGRALELAIGTGRVALRLAARGVEVHGIDLSQAMVRRLRSKPGADRIGVTIGDIASTTVPGGAGTFRLVYLVYNTIMNLTSQAAQVACFRNAAAHLEPGGHFLIEVQVPDLRRLPPGERYVVFDAGEAHWGIDEYDVANQGLVSHHFTDRDGLTGKDATPFRYVWPGELDLMAEMAGMQLVDRWAGWDRSPFSSESRMHASVWAKPYP